MLDFCVNEYNKKQEELVYKIYITDSIRAYLDIDVRFYDLISREPKEERSADEIINSLKDGLSNLGD